MPRVHPHIYLPLLSVLMLAANSTHARPQGYIDSQGRVVVGDTTDPRYPFVISPLGPSKVLTKTSITFSVTYADVTNATGFGFDDPITGADFRAVVERVLVYVDSVLNESGAVDILFEESLNNPQASLLASAGPFFGSIEKFTNGDAFQRITTGIDPNGVSFPEISAQVNFGNPWFTGEGLPAQDQFDFFSVMLHELTHGLGILSFASADGESSLPNVYSVWDSYLERSSASLLIDLFAAARLPSFIGAPADLTSDEVVFRGPASQRSLGSLAPVFAPLEFDKGSSLGHLDESIEGDVVMKPRIAKGVAIREYADFELGVLQDLGYRVDVAQFCPADSDPPIKTPIPPTQLSGEPWNPGTLRSAGKVLYGDDDRLDLYQETDPGLLQLAAATCALVPSTSVVDNGDGTYTLLVQSYRPGGFPPCFDEPFLDQPTAAICSGFLAAPDIVVTAGHCYSDDTLERLHGLVFVFGFQMLDATTPAITLDHSQVYTGAEFISRSFEAADPLNYAIIRLDREVTAAGAAPLEFRTAGALAPGTQVGVIGNPSGLPQKIAFGDTYVTANCNDVFFVANTDTYDGSSGSPVFDAATGVVEGILVRGDRDFLILNDVDGDCGLSNTIVNSGGAEEITKTTAFAQFIPKSLGNISLDRSMYACDDTVLVQLTDLDLRNDETVEVTLTTTAGDTELLTLTESGVGSEAFAGSIAAAPGSAMLHDGALQVAQGDTITAAYLDQDNGSGAQETVTATASVHCSPMLEVTPSSGEFGEAELNTSNQLLFTLTNAGTGTLSGGVTTASPFSVASGETYTIDQDESATVIINFSPAAEGVFSESLNFTGGGGATIILAGTGVTTPIQCAATQASSPHSAIGDLLLALLLALTLLATGRYRSPS